MVVGQGPIALVAGAGGGCLDIFSLIYLFSFLSPSLWETARYRLKYCLKGPLNPKQPTNKPTFCAIFLPKYLTGCVSHCYIVVVILQSMSLSSSLRLMSGSNFPPIVASEVRSFTSIYTFLLLFLFRQASISLQWVSIQSSFAFAIFRAL